jgi:hypothetical protein
MGASLIFECVTEKSLEFGVWWMVSLDYETYLTK